MERFGSVDILVNNAATNPYMGPTLGISASQMDKTHSVNQRAIVLWTAAAWEASMREHGGSVINIASVGGMQPDVGAIGYYNATKAAVLHLTTQLANELAPKVRVNAIAPGTGEDRLRPRALGTERSRLGRDDAVEAAGRAGRHRERCGVPRLGCGQLDHRPQPRRRRRPAPALTPLRSPGARSLRSLSDAE